MWMVESLTWGGVEEQLKEGLSWTGTFEMGIEE